MIRRLLVISLLTVFLIMGSSPLLPITGSTNTEGELGPGTALSSLPALGRNGNSNSIRQISKVIVQGRFNYDVIDQPVNNPGFVSSAENTLTRFRLADRYGSIGILAHNHLAGASFLDLELGDRIDVVFENDPQGQLIQSYWVFSVRKFQALSPTSPYSEFIDLKNGQQYSASQLFLEIYDRDDLLILQTCLEKDGVDSWGRIFVIAYPLSSRLYKPWPQGVELALVH